MEAEEMVLGGETEVELQIRHPDIMGKDHDQQIIRRIKDKLSPRQFNNPMGARIYIDRGRILEGATPECSGVEAAFLLSLYLRAMDETFEEAKRQILEEDEIFRTCKNGFHLLKGSFDRDQNWAGYHLNVRTPCYDDIPVIVAKLVKNLALYFATNIIWAGRGGIQFLGNQSFYGSRKEVGYVFSPRAKAVGVLSSAGASSIPRGFIAIKGLFESNSYDTPLWRRFEIISGDALHSDFINYVNSGVIALITRLISKNGFPESFPHISEEHVFKIHPQSDFILDFQAINRDPTLTSKIRLPSGEKFSALQIQEMYFELLNESEKVLSLTEEDKKILQYFGKIIKALKNNPLDLADRCECWFHYLAMEGLLQRFGATWQNAHLKEIVHRKKKITVAQYILEMYTYQAASFDKDWGIWPKLVRSGRVFTLHPPESVAFAKRNPPPGRAALRTEIFKRAENYSLDVHMAKSAHEIDSSWSDVVIPYLDKVEFYINLSDPFETENETRLKKVETFLAAALTIKEELTKTEPPN